MSEEKSKSIRDAYHYYLKNPDLNQDRLLSILQNYDSAWTKERKTYHDEAWRNNISFYSGNHYVRDSIGSSSRYRAKLKENHTNNTLARMMSIFVQNMPITRVFSASSSDEDQKNSENTEAYAKYFWRIKKLEQKIIKFIKYTCIMGNGFIYPSWNPDIGERVSIGEDDEGDNSNKDRYYNGDIQVEIDNPFRIKVRPGIEEMDDMYDFIRTVPANKAHLEFMHGEINSDPVNSLNAFDNSIRSDSDICLQNHYHHEPTPWFEEGLYVSWVGKKIIKVRPASQAEAKLPLIHLPFDRPPMRFYGMSSIEQIMDLQEQLNRASSMIIEARNLIARPRVFIPNESKLPGQSISDQPGAVYRYAKEGGPPIFNVPSFQFAEMQAHKTDLRNALQDVMGITSASRGEVPAAIKTALGLQMVLEQDRSQYVPFIKNLYQAIQDTMSGVLNFAAANIDEDDPRVLKIEGQTSHRTFHGGMVPSPLDIYLEDNNPLGWTAAARTEQVSNLIDKHVVTDQNQIFEMLKINNTDPAFKHLTLHKNAAQRENEDFKKGRHLDIGLEDDDKIHLDEHVPPVASYQFRREPKMVKDAYEFHIQQHKNRISGLDPKTGQPMGGAAQPPPAAPPADPSVTQAGSTPEQIGQAVQSPVQAQNMEHLLSK